MPKAHKKKRPPKRILALPDLEHSKTAVLNTLTSKSGQRTYDRAITHFVDWVLFRTAHRIQPYSGSGDTGSFSNRSSIAARICDLRTTIRLVRVPPSWKTLENAVPRVQAVVYNPDRPDRRPTVRVKG
jgi:hypothetical protein